MLGAVHVVICKSPGVEDNPAHVWRLQCWVKSRLGVDDASFGADCKSLNVLPSFFCILRAEALSDPPEC
eukprot:2549827-Pyramimonas_sp.AAC.1